MNLLIYVFPQLYLLYSYVSKLNKQTCRIAKLMVLYPITNIIILLAVIYYILYVNPVQIMYWEIFEIFVASMVPNEVFAYLIYESSEENRDIKINIEYLRNKSKLLVVLIVPEYFCIKYFIKTRNWLYIISLTLNILIKLFFALSVMYGNNMIISLYFYALSNLMNINLLFVKQ
jgi:hypothetical protein